METFIKVAFTVAVLITILAFCFKDGQDLVPKKVLSWIKLIGIILSVIFGSLIYLL